MDRDAYHAPSRSLNALTLVSTLEWLSRPHLAWYYIVTPAVDAFAPMMSYIHFGRAPEADFEVGPVRYGVFARDWRREDGVAWLERMEERELATDAPPPARSTPRPNSSERAFSRPSSRPSSGPRASGRSCC